MLRSGLPAFALTVEPSTASFFASFREEDIPVAQPWISTLTIIRRSNGCLRPPYRAQSALRPSASTVSDTKCPQSADSRSRGDGGSRSGWSGQ